MSDLLEVVRRFGLEYCDLTTMLWNIGVMLRILILNIDSANKTRPNFFWYIITFMLNSCYFYVYIVSSVYYVGWKYPIIKDTITAVIIISLGVSSVIGAIKYIYIFFGRETFIKIIDEFRVCDSTVVPDSRLHVNILKTLRFVKRRALIFWIVLVNNGFLYTLLPIFQTGTHLPEDGQVLLGLEPMFESPNFEFAYIAMSFGVIQTCFVSANVSALFILLLGYLEAQMLALTQEMLSLWPDAQEYAEKECIGYPKTFESDGEYQMTVNMFIKRGLREIIQRHSAVKSLFTRLDNIFRVIIAMEFILLMIGVIFELLGGLENTYLQMPYAFMLVTMDCLSGQRLIDASVELEYAVYACNWENFDVTNRKTVAMMLRCSQRKLAMSAGGVTSLSFITLMSVIRSVYSAYATLRQTIHRS